MKTEIFQSRLAPMPRDIIFEVTYRCNLKCEMCYLQDNFLNKKYPEMDINQIESFLDGLYPHKPTIILTGGEAFVRTDILSIVKAVKKREMRCCLFSNGTLLTDEKIERLIELDIDSISFSLDGPKEIFEEITLIPGSFDRLMKNLKTLFDLRSNQKLQITLSGVLSNHSIDHIDFLLDFANNSNISLVSLLHLHFLTEPYVKANHLAFKQYGISHAQNAVNRHTWNSDPELAHKIIKLKKKLKTNEKIEFVPDISEQEILEWYGIPESYPVSEYCFYPWTTSRIAPDGSVYICQNHVLKMGNVVDEPFPHIWNNERFQHFRQILREQGMFPGCNRCCKVKTYTRKEFPNTVFPVAFY